MDPGANLREQHQIAYRLVEADESEDSFPYDARRLAELVIAHRDWRGRAGFEAPSLTQHLPSMPHRNPVDPSRYNPPWTGVFSIPDPPQMDPAAGS